MASFDRTIPPGGEGKITLTINTKGYQRDIHKVAAVYTNDPKIPRFTLGMRAFVQVPVLISPAHIYFQGSGEEPITRAVKIEAGLEKPLIIATERFNLEDKVDYEIREIEKGRSYLIRFTSIPGNPGSFSGFLNLKTNYEEKPLITINIRAKFMQRKIDQGKSILSN